MSFSYCSYCYVVVAFDAVLVFMGNHLADKVHGGVVLVTIFLLDLLRLYFNLL